MNAVLIEVLCGCLGSKFRSEISTVSRLHNRIAIRVSCENNPMFKRILMRTCARCIWLGKSRAYKRDNPWHRCSGSQHDNACTRSFSMHIGTKVCYHLLMRLKCRKILQRRFHRYMDADALEFALRYNSLYLWDPICRVIAAGMPAPKRLFARYTPMETLEHATRAALLCCNLAAFDQIITSGYTFLPTRIIAGIPVAAREHISVNYVFHEFSHGYGGIHRKKVGDI